MIDQSMVFATYQAKRAIRYFVALIGLTFAWMVLQLGAQLAFPTFDFHGEGVLGLVPWAILCGIAAWRQHLLAWTALCLTPLALVSLAWLADLDMLEDPFGMRWRYIIAFSTFSLVTAATGIIALIAPHLNSPLERKAVK